MIEQESAEIERNVPLSLAIVVALAALLVSLVFILIDNGVTLSNMSVLLDHPAALSEFIGEAVGYTFLLPLIHLGVSSIFKSKRNQNTRRSIFIG